MTFEQSLKRLEEIVAALNRDDVPLDRALALFEEATKHLNQAHAELQRAEGALLVLTKNVDGTLRTIPHDE